MTLTELRYIVALAREKHFGNAAQACFVSQPSLSIAVKKIEDELSVKLFERGSTEVTPTLIGERVIEQANRVLEEVEAIRHLAQQGRDPLSGTLKIGIISTIASYLMLELVAKLREVAPKMPLIVCENHTTKLVEMLKQGEIDVLICSQLNNSTGFVVQPLFDEPFVVAMSPTHALAKKTLLAMSDIENEHVLLLSSSHCFRDQILQYWPGLNRSHPIDISGHRNHDGCSLDALGYMAGSGIGITIMPILRAKHTHAKHDPLVYRAFEEPAPKRRVVLVWRKRYPRSQAVRVLLQAICSCHFNEDGVEYRLDDPLSSFGC